MRDQFEAALPGVRVLEGKPHQAAAAVAVLWVGFLGRRVGYSVFGGCIPWLVGLHLFSSGQKAPVVGVASEYCKRI